MLYPASHLRPANRRQLAHPSKRLRQPGLLERRIGGVAVHRIPWHGDARSRWRLPDFVGALAVSQQRASRLLQQPHQLRIEIPAHSGRARAAGLHDMLDAQRPVALGGGHVGFEQIGRNVIDDGLHLVERRGLDAEAGQVGGRDKPDFGFGIEGDCNGEVVGGGFGHGTLYAPVSGVFQGTRSGDNAQPPTAPT
jgi:hypothetical protein